jgi:hypothetical protein
MSATRPNWRSRMIRKRQLAQQRKRAEYIEDMLPAKLRKYRPGEAEVLMSENSSSGPEPVADKPGSYQQERKRFFSWRDRV